MVLKKRLDYGFSGFQVPRIPKAPRSARRRVPSKKANEDDHACAFELLALAGMLLQGNESSASSNASEENQQRPAFSQAVAAEDRQDEVKPLTANSIHQGSCTESLTRTEAASQNSSQKPLRLPATADCVQRCISANNNSDRRDNKVGGDVKSEICESDNKFYRRVSFPSASYSKHGNCIKLGFRDDDENFLRRTKVSAKSRAVRSPRHMAHRRIRKHLFPKHWKAAPKLKEYELSRSDMGVKPLYLKRKTFERSEHKARVKRRKTIDRVSGVISDGGLSSESVSNSPEKGMDGDNPSTSEKLHVPKDSRVKFSIKSIRIPELYLEVPETATVGSLKSTIMEAVMSILGGGVHVGVLLQEKKVRDDNRSLTQTGISCKENLDTLSFMLEPSSLQDSAAVCDTSQPTGSPETPVLDSGITDTPRDDSLLTNPDNLVESNHESTTSSATDPIDDKMTPDSRALVVVPSSTEALSVVPVSQKTKRSKFMQRRTRRPFSVSEVEALVHAVEELGTGRWRDVKLRSFENADHRTYVDLKDKWKTLVHTAKIAPQQRRGEPVPQELLDRVLAAHGYWTQHQAKQHGKHQAERPSIEGGVHSLVMV